MIRIDERLIHGQVALIWTKELGVNRIVVVNNKAANNSTMISTLKMATPDNIKCIVLEVEKGVELLNNPRTEALKMLVVVNNVEDAKVLCQRVKNIPLLNVGNYGRADGKISQKEKITDNLFLSEEDKSDFKEIFETGVDVEYQIVPGQQKKKMKELINLK